MTLLRSIKLIRGISYLDIYKIFFLKKVPSIQI